MSFPRARTRRFNEDIGCAPGVGHYNPNVEKKSSNVVFDKCSRFQGNSSSSDSVFVPPKTLIKCGITRSALNLHEISNRSSCSSMGSQECLLPKKKMDRRNLSETDPVSLQTEVKELRSTLQDKENHIAHLMDVIAKLDESKAEVEELNKSKLESLEKLVMKLIDVKDLRINVSTNGSSTEQLDKLKSDLLQLYTQFQTVMSNMRNSKNKVKELESLLDTEVHAKESAVSDGDAIKTDLKELQVRFDLEMAEKANLVSDLESLKNKLYKQNNKIEFLSEQCRISSLDLQVKDIEIQQFQFEAKAVETTQESLISDLEDTRKKLGQVQSDFDVSRKEMGALRCALEASNEKNSSLEHRINTNLDEIRYLNCEVNERILQIHSLQKELEEKSRVYELSLKEETANFTELERNINLLNIQLQEVQSELNCKVAEIASTKSDFDKLEGKYESVIAELGFTKQEMNKCHEQWNQAVASIQVVLSEKKAVEELCENLRIDMVFKEETVNSLSAEVKSKDEALKLMESKQLSNEISINELRYELDFFKAALEKSEMDRQKLLCDVMEKESLIGELENIGVEVESTVAVLRNELEQKEKELENLEEKWMQCNGTLKDASTEIKQKDKRLSNLESSLLRCQDSLQESLTENANLSRQLCAAEDRLAQSSTAVELMKLELTTKDEQLEAAMESIRGAEQKQEALRDELQELAEELLAKSTDLGSLQQKHQELMKNQDSEKWKLMYESLEAKIAPFKDQLDAYSLERESLIQENDHAFKELSELGEKYAKMMGHQNHKQKIQYLVKLKEEIIELKKENSRLRATHTTPKKEMARKVTNSAKKAPLKSMENTPAYF